MNFFKDITWTEIFIFAHTCAALVCMLRVLYKQKNIGSTFAWLIILFLFPVFGTIAYILIGEPRLGTARAKRTGEMNRFYRNFAATHLADIYLDIADQVKSRYHGISKVAEKGTGLGATKGNAMSLLSTTDAIIDSMLADIRAATHSCLLAFYIIEPKGRIEEILNEILAAADRGVDCAILAVHYLRVPTCATTAKSSLSTAKLVTPAASTSSTRAISNKTPALENGSMS